MSERGIILKSEQVLAFLGGATQMRVPMKKQPPSVVSLITWHEHGMFLGYDDQGRLVGPSWGWKSPFGVPGDTVAIKESEDSAVSIVRTVKRVWVERVYDIIPGDCIASIGNIPGSSDYAGDPDEHPWDYYNRCFASPFVKYWDKTWGNPKLPLDQEDPMLYESGPWVWCAEFEDNSEVAEEKP